MAELPDGRCFLQGFNFNVQYRPGKLNGNADSLSRCYAAQQEGEDRDYNKLLNGEPISTDSKYHRAVQDIFKEGDTLWIQMPKGKQKNIPSHAREAAV
jgi:hypothetical protein